MSERMLTTHVGSLPRPDDLVEMMQMRVAGAEVPDDVFAARVTAAVAETVKHQVDIGLDIVADGEMGKLGFLPYINERIAGFTPNPNPGDGSYWGQSREARAFPGYYEWAAQQSGTAGNVNSLRWEATGPISYQGQAALEGELADLRAAVGASGAGEAFVPSISPANVEDWNFNRHYDSDEEYLYAIADAMRDEYEAILDAGFFLQVDDPLLATYYVMHPEKSIDECREWATVRVKALNHALRDLPQDRIRYHTCYSINIGPRVHDMELQSLIDILVDVNAGAYSFEAANPRHEHEWKLWEDVDLPDSVTLIPGVITHSSQLVEHPDLVAQRLDRFASLVGPERIIAGADCGFASFATSHEMHPEIVWAKLEALVEGTRRFSEEG